MIKNAKGQFYAVECETLEENNRVFEILGTIKVTNYYKYSTTDNGIYDNDLKRNEFDIIKFKDWIKLTEQPTMITMPIEDYNRLRKLEIKEQIRKLKKEYDTL